MNIIEYHPNGKIKHRICYFDNGGKRFEYFRDENEQTHRDNLPAYQQWDESGRLRYIEYYHHGKNHNINGPAYVGYDSNGKIVNKNHYCRNTWYAIFKLDWTNKIKNI